MFTSSPVRPGLSRKNTCESSEPSGRYDSRWVTALSLLKQERQNAHEKMKGKTRIKINVSGLVFETFSSTLERFPETLLGDIKRRMKYYYAEQDEFFFNRNRDAFESIFQYYQTYGKLIKPEGMSLKDFIEELQFFELGEEAVNHFKAEMHYTDEKEEPSSKRGWLGKLWSFLEHPETSKAAGIFGIISQSIILLSIVCFCLETVEGFVADPGRRNFLDYAEIFVVAFFTAEYLIRFIASPNKWKFFKAALNIIDLLAILPFYVRIINDAISPERSKSMSAGSIIILRSIRLLRILRIFKLARHMSIFKILGKTIAHSGRNLALLGFFLAIAITLFSSSIYYAEQKTFGSIPGAFWWCVITITNVGYGDLVPVTGLGKLIGSLCSFSGIITLALPIPVIVSSFMYFYNMEKENQRASTGKPVSDEGYRKKVIMMRNIFGVVKQRRKFSSINRARVSPSVSNINMPSARSRGSRDQDQPSSAYAH